MTARAGEAAVRRAVVRACRRLDARQLVAGTEGNVSARLGRGRVVVTPSGAVKAEVAPRDLVVVPLADGRPVNRTLRQAPRRARPSSELPMHVEVYRARPDVGAVVHAHPPVATGFAVARRPLNVAALAELAGVIGPVPVAPYRRPGTAALGKVVAAALSHANACLLANHGVVAVGRTVAEALARMESVEQAARILATAHILGKVTELGHSAVLDLAAVRTGVRSARQGRMTRTGRRK